MHFSDLGAIAITLALVFAVYAVVVSVLGARLALPSPSARPEAGTLTAVPPRSGTGSFALDAPRTGGIRLDPPRRGAGGLLVSGQRAVLLVTTFLVAAAVALAASFVTHDFGATYVAEHSSLSMPWYYTISAFYGGQEGSLLYWALMLSLFSAIAVLTARRAPAYLMPYVVATLMTIETFFLVLLTFVASPFTRGVLVPRDGQGLNPLLLDPGMLVHPPMLLMGYMSFSLPFAFAMAAMISGRLDTGWLRAIRRWMLAAWSIQTAGLLLGMWWAYHVLGWGGYWGWDPVENAALMPWLTATAFLHSSMVQERRGTLKVWNLSLVLATFALSIFGTFEVRSGIINSVHSFAYSAIGPYFLGFLVLVLLVSIGLFVFRLPQLRPEQEMESIVSREGSFLINNLLLVAITFATFWGTIFPLISQTFRNQQMTVGAPFYDQVNGPLFAVLIFVMGVGPLLAWRRASRASIWRNFRWPALAAAVIAVALPLLGMRAGWAIAGFTLCTFAAWTILYEVWRGVRVRHGHGEDYLGAFARLVGRHRQRYGGYLVHLGLVTLAIGVIGSQFFQTKAGA
ncbi:MAG TPA: cytochrome c-type biogenesis CcmF C-terminal domain-containing protein, partial [Ktedonobacterales bacterium]|nr:cytochrome c-type biogenesis CcmF C-terminal domain-containing protein [Ktedonobacterales bacterium]